MLRALSTQRNARNKEDEDAFFYLVNHILCLFSIKSFRDDLIQMTEDVVFDEILVVTHKNKESEVLKCVTALCRKLLRVVVKEAGVLLPLPELLLDGVTQTFISLDVLNYAFPFLEVKHRRPEKRSIDCVGNTGGITGAKTQD